MIPDPRRCVLPLLPSVGAGLVPDLPLLKAIPLLAPWRMVCFVVPGGRDRLRPDASIWGLERSSQPHHPRGQRDGGRER